MMSSPFCLLQARIALAACADLPDLPRAIPALQALFQIGGEEIVLHASIDWLAASPFATRARAQRLLLPCVKQCM